MPSIDDLRSPDPRVNAEAWRVAFPVLWRAAQQILHVVLTGPQHEQDREDIATKAIGELAHSLIKKELLSFNQIETFDDLLDMTRQIVRSRTKDFFRWRSRRPEILVEEVPETVVTGWASSPLLNRAELDSLVAQLPPPQPEIFGRHYVQGQTAEEIAGALGMSRNTVLSHLFRGVKKLRKLLDDSARRLVASGTDSNFPP